MNQWWDLGDGRVKNGQQIQSEEVEVENVLEESVSTQRADGWGESSLEDPLKWRGSENAKVCGGAFLWLFNSDTEEEDFGGVRAQEEDESSMDDFPWFTSDVLLPL